VTPTRIDVKLPAKALFLLSEHHRYKGLVGGRGSGKSRSISASLVVRGANERLRGLCARETQKSLEFSSRQIIADQIERIGLQSQYEVLKSQIRGRHRSYSIPGTKPVDGIDTERNTVFIFEGIKEMSADALKSIEGFDVCWIAECHALAKASWDKLTPTFRLEHSEIWYDFNPDLEDDFIYKFSINPPPNAKVAWLNYSDNPWFPEVLRVDMEHMKATDYPNYQHIWEGKPKSAADGAIFAEEMKQVDAEGRICSVPYDRTKPVHVVCDMGFGDLFSMWFVQFYGGFINLIDFYENNQRDMSHYALVAKSRGYVLGSLVLPHDAANNLIHKRLAGASDLRTSIPDTLKELGFDVRLSPALLKADKRTIARAKFPACRFDADKCADGIRHLRYYQWNKERDSEGRMPDGKIEPLHNEHSHASDAFMEVCSVSDQLIHRAPPPKPRLQAIIPSRSWG